LADADEMLVIDDPHRTTDPHQEGASTNMDPVATLVFAITVLLTLDVVAARLVGRPTDTVSRR